MPYGENIDEQGNVRAPVSYDKRQIAATKFQQQQERLPLQDALAVAKLQHEQAALQFQGQSELHSFQKETQLLREGSAYYAGLPVLQKYLDNQVASGKQEFQKGGRGYAEAYANFAAQFPSAIAHNSEVAKDVADNAKVHDLAAQINQNLGIVNNLKLQPGQSVDVGEPGSKIHQSEKQSQIGELPRTEYAKARSQVEYHNTMIAAGLKKDANFEYDPKEQAAMNSQVNLVKSLQAQFPGIEKGAVAPATVAAPATQALATDAAQAATSAATPATQQPAAGLPSVGDTRVINGNTFNWNGNRWDPQ